MDFSIDEETRAQLEVLREWGEKEVRPVGLEADREGRPIPVEHPFFERCLFVVLEEQTVLVRGRKLRNYRMERVLPTKE